jgi:hypothetical protein
MARSAQSGLGRATCRRDLVAEDQDLHVLGGIAARQEGQLAEHADYE